MSASNVIFLGRLPKALQNRHGKNFKFDGTLYTLESYKRGTPIDLTQQISCTI